MVSRAAVSRVTVSRAVASIVKVRNMHRTLTVTASVLGSGRGGAGAGAGVGVGVEAEAWVRGWLSSCLADGQSFARLDHPLVLQQGIGRAPRLVLRHVHGRGCRQLSGRGLATRNRLCSGLGRGGLQPYVMEPMAICDRACNRMWWWSRPRWAARGAVQCSCCSVWLTVGLLLTGKAYYW